MGSRGDERTPRRVKAKPRRNGRNEMPRNVGSWDRGLRIVVGIILLALVVIGPKTWWGLWG
jgi:Protein of unknown function (DUF2892)